MTSHPTRRLLVAAGLLAAGATGALAQADAFPQRPVTLIVPFLASDETFAFGPATRNSSTRASTMIGAMSWVGS